MEKEKNKGKREERKGNESHDQPNHPRSPLPFRPPVISTAKLRDSPSTSVRTNGRVDMVENDPRDSLHLSLSLYPLLPPPLPSSPHSFFDYHLTLSRLIRNAAVFESGEKFDGPNLISL